MGMFMHAEWTTKIVPNNFHFLSNANGAFKVKLDNIKQCTTGNDINQAEDGKGYYYGGSWKGRQVEQEVRVDDQAWLSEGGGVK